jgi:hypothetical protein
VKVLASVKGCEGFAVNYMRRAHMGDLHIKPSHPSQSLKTKGKTLHNLPFTPFTTLHWQVQP